MERRSIATTSAEQLNAGDVVGASQTQGGKRARFVNVKGTGGGPGRVVGGGRCPGGGGGVKHTCDDLHAWLAPFRAGGGPLHLHGAQRGDGHLNDQDLELQQVENTQPTGGWHCWGVSAYLVSVTLFSIPTAALSLFARGCSCLLCASSLRVLLLPCQGRAGVAGGEPQEERRRSGKKKKKEKGDDDGRGKHAETRRALASTLGPFLLFPDLETGDLIRVCRIRPFFKLFPSFPFFSFLLSVPFFVRPFRLVAVVVFCALQPGSSRGLEVSSFCGVGCGGLRRR